MESTKRWLVIILATSGYFLQFLPIPYFPFLIALLIKQVMGKRKIGCILIQSFGRGSWEDEKLVGTLKPVIEQFEEDPEVGFRMLENKHFNPGKSNYALAEATIQLHQKTGAPIIAQWEVAYCIWITATMLFSELVKTDEIIVLWPKGRYYTTREVKTDSKSWMKIRGWSDPIEIAHPDMIIRALMIMWKLGMNPMIYPCLIPYDRESVQPWTKTWFSWYWRNFLTHGHHLKYLWVKFSPPN